MYRKAFIKNLMNDKEQASMAVLQHLNSKQQ